MAYVKQKQPFRSVFALSCRFSRTTCMQFMVTLPVKYIFVPDLPDEFKKKSAVSTVMVYFDVDALKGIQGDQEDIAEKKKEEAEQAEARERLAELRQLLKPD